ncbi:MAG TPA: hypothetical protein VEX37_02875 [Thermomicrobiales bacterium]|nr:hypothetical protein [Thermomicrobiales bacterium]
MNETAMLELSDGSVAIVDNEDLSRVAAYEWSLPSHTAARYPVGSQCRRSNACETVYLHRLITNAGPEDMVYHRNHNTLDNRRENLVVMARRMAPAYVQFEACDSLLAD